MNAEIFLPASKSISNRVLIIQALAESNALIHNLSEANDTKNLLRCLQSQSNDIHVGEGATTLRFLLAYYAIIQKRITLHCGLSLQTRPLRVLLEILEQLGCQFRYLEKEYQLPLEIISGVQENYSKKIIIDTSTSSQFVSAILLIAPYFKNGLEIEYTEEIVSEPYIQMTKKLMTIFGGHLEENGNSVKINPSKYIFHNYHIESDWSAACFFFAFLGIHKSGTIFFPNLRVSGLQGDEIMIDFFTHFGIDTIEEPAGMRINKIKDLKPDFIEFDFTNYPDLFPPISMFCAITKTNAYFKGLQHLAFKESNRLKVISEFLLQQNVKITNQKTKNGILSADFEMSTFNTDIPDHYLSHNDHRISMSFSLLNTIRKITIENPEVVQKSFPEYWVELKKII